MDLISQRAGAMVKNLRGYSSFIPKSLPPMPPVQVDDEMQSLLSLADRKLGRLDGITQILPNPELFVAMYVKKEAVLSSQIEGTQASMIDLLNTPEDSDASRYAPDAVREVVNYVDAMYSGLERLKQLPLSLRLIKEIHGILLTDVRGAERNPGEFRTSQNWIGTPGCTLETAAFVPPDVEEMTVAMGELELFMHREDRIPALIKIALIHAQFETIHPFLDGNGRMGRLLITFWLCQQEILGQPLLYLSYYFKQNRQEYYDRLMAVRFNGDWEGWVKFFLRGVAVVSDEATSDAKQIIGLQSTCEKLLSDRFHGNGQHYRLLDILFERPFISKKEVAKLLGVSTPTAGTLVEEFCQLRILIDVSPERKRDKRYAFGNYMAILQKGTELRRPSNA